MGRLFPENTKMRFTDSGITKRDAAPDYDTSIVEAFGENDGQVMSVLKYVSSS